MRIFSRYRFASGTFYRIGLAAVGVMLAATPLTQASSSIVNPAPGYQANDLLTANSFGGYDVAGNQVVGWVNKNLTLFNTATGTSTNLGGAPSAYLTAQSNNIYNSFVKYDPSSSSTVYVGFTTSGNADDRVYQVNITGNTANWTNLATVKGNGDLAFSGTTAYVAGLNSSGAAIYKLTGSTPEQIAVAGTNTSGLAFDASGNLDYATYDGYGSPAKLLQWTAAQVAAASSSSPLTTSNATVLSTLPGGAYDTAIDSAGHVLFDLNGISTGSPSLLGMWNGVSGSSANYTTLATNKSAYSGPFFTNLATTGDLTQSGGGVFVADPYDANGLALVNVPEPASVALLLVGGVLLLIPRRRAAQA